MPYTPNKRVPFVAINTSEDAAAYQESTGKASTDRLRLTEYLRACGPRGSTTDAAEVELGLLHQTCSARMKDLIDDGVLANDDLMELFDHELAVPLEFLKKVVEVALFVSHVRSVRLRRSSKER